MTRHISRTFGRYNPATRNLLILATLAALVAWLATGTVAALAEPPSFSIAIETNLTPNDAGIDYRFGSSVAVSGDTVVVAALDADSVYVFVRPAEVGRATSMRMPSSFSAAGSPMSSEAR